MPILHAFIILGNLKYRQNCSLSTKCETGIVLQLMPQKGQRRNDRTRMGPCHQIFLAASKKGIVLQFYMGFVLLLPYLEIVGSPGLVRCLFLAFNVHGIKMQFGPSVSFEKETHI